MPHPFIKNVKFEKTETRFVKASVRKQGAQGNWQTKIFATEVPVTGSYHAVAEAAIKDINAQGWEVNHIIEHSTKRECL